MRLTPKQEQYTWECEQLHDYVLLMANAGLRPDEAMRLEYRDVQIVRDAATNETILQIEVRGKRGVGHCKSMMGAALQFRRLKKRNNPQQSDRLFPKNQRELLNTIIDKEEDPKVGCGKRSGRIVVEWSGLVPTPRPRPDAACRDRSELVAEPRDVSRLVATRDYAACLRRPRERIVRGKNSQYSFSLN